MTDINPEVFIRRNKLRRQFETEFGKINRAAVEFCKDNAIENSYHFRYSPHLLDRAIQREIDETYMFKLLRAVKEHSQEISDFLALPPLPHAEQGTIDTDGYRPLRLEITDGNLWLGITVDPKTSKYNTYGLCCRMAFVNNKRLPGKISTKVIKVK